MKKRQASSEDAIFRSLRVGASFSKKFVPPALLRAAKPEGPGVKRRKLESESSQEESEDNKREALKEETPEDAEHADGEEDDEAEAPETAQQSDATLSAKSLRKKLHLKVDTADVPAPLVSWSSLEERYELPAYLKDHLKTFGYESPTPIQAQAIPCFLEGRHMCCCAPTGSGKTLAFALPMLQLLKEPARDGFRGVVVAPSRELAAQIHREFARLSKNRKWHIHLLTPANANSNSLGDKEKLDILIATPDLLAKAIKDGAVKLNKVQYLVLDEADRLFEDEYVLAIDEIIHACDSAETKATQVRALFSATIPPKVDELSKAFLRQPVRILVGARNSAASNIKQKLIYAGKEEGKLLALRDFFRGGFNPPVLVFVQSKERAEQLASELAFDDLRVEVMSPYRTAAERDSVIARFRSGDIWVLIATDLLARGMDFKGVKCVINFDMPLTLAQYIHRIGRTGRAGRTGEAVTFYTEADLDMLRTIANVMKNSGQQVDSWMLNAPKLSSRKRKQLKKYQPPARKAISNVENDEKTKARRKAFRKKTKLLKFGHGKSE